MTDKEKNSGDHKTIPNTSSDGMLRDGTEEQNLNQPGNTAARINKEELDAAFIVQEK